MNLEELNQSRLWVLEPLRPLREAMKASEVTIASMTEALKIWIQHMELKEKLEEYQEYFSDRGRFGDQNLSREYGQVYDLVMELMERLTGLLGDEKVDQRTYGQILDAGFEEIQVGTIPATIDQVTVGDITRSRLDGVKALFFVGVNDQIVPQRKNGGSLLSDRDREFFRAQILFVSDSVQALSPALPYLRRCCRRREVHASFKPHWGGAKAFSRA